MKGHCALPECLTVMPLLFTIFHVSGQQMQSLNFFRCCSHNNPVINSLAIQERLHNVMFVGHAVDRC